MALITDLPAASSLAATDLLIKDTGSATQKITVSDAYGSDTNPGFVSTGAQTFAGAKTFTSQPIIKNASTAGASLGFALSDIASGTRTAYLVELWDASSGARFEFDQYSANSDGTTSTGFRERYQLPETTQNRSANAVYQIWTTKQIPAPPSTTGTYVLKATRTSSGVTYSWVAD